MRHRNPRDLRFIVSQAAVPSLEVEVDGLEDADIDIFEVVEKVLAAFLKAHPDARATVYNQVGTSAACGEDRWCEFLTPVGDAALLPALRLALAGLGSGAARVRDVVPEQGTETFHLEGGFLWQPSNDVRWFALEPSDGPASSR